MDHESEINIYTIQYNYYYYYCSQPDLHSLENTIDSHYVHGLGFGLMQFIKGDYITLTLPMCLEGDNLQHTLVM